MCPILTGPRELGPVPAARSGHPATNTLRSFCAPTVQPRTTSQVSSRHLNPHLSSCFRAAGRDNATHESRL